MYWHIVAQFLKQKVSLCWTVCAGTLVTVRMLPNKVLLALLNMMSFRRCVCSVNKWWCNKIFDLFVSGIGWSSWSHHEELGQDQEAEVHKHRQHVLGDHREAVCVEEYRLNWPLACVCHYLSWWQSTVAPVTVNAANFVTYWSSRREFILLLFQFSFTSEMHGMQICQNITFGGKNQNISAWYLTLSFHVALLSFNQSSVTVGPRACRCSDCCWFHWPRGVTICKTWTTLFSLHSSIHVVSTKLV